MAYDGSLVFDTKIDASGFKKGLSKISAIGAGVTKSILGAGAAMTAIGGYATKISIDFESAFAGVRKTVDATDKEFDILRQSIIDMSKELPSSASDIAGVAEAAGQLGIEKDKIIKFTRTMVDLGEATNLTSEQAATALARFSNIVGMSQNNFDKLGSVIVALGNNLATTESEIVEMGLRLAGTGKQIGLSESQILSLAGAMSSVGINAEAGGSSMSRVLQKINTQVLSGGKNLSKFAAIAGMSASSFSNSWKDDPQNTIKAFVKGLNNISKSGGDVTSVLKELKMSSIQEIDTLSRLAGAYSVLENSFNIGNDAWKDNIALANEAAQRYGTTESKLRILKNTADSLAIGVGDNLKEGLTGLIDVALSSINELSKAFDIGGLSGLVSSTGSVFADIIGRLTTETPQFIKVGNSVIKNLLQGLNDNMPSITQALSDGMTELVKGLADIVPLFLDTGAKFLLGLGNGILNNLPTITASLSTMIGNIANFLVTNIPLFINMGVSLLTALVNGFSANPATFVTTIITLVNTLATSITENIPNIVNCGITLITALAQGIADNLPLLIETVPKIINDFASAIYNQGPKILKAALDIIIILGKGLIEAIPTLIKNIPQIILAIVNVFTLYNWHKVGTDFIKAIKNGAVDFKNNIVSGIKSIGDSIINKITSLLNGGNIIDIGKNFINAIKDGIISLKSSIWDKACEVANYVIDGIKGVFSWEKITSIGDNLIKGIAEGISNAKEWIFNIIKNFGAAVIDKIKSVFGIHSPSVIMRDEVGKNIVKGIAVGIKQEQKNLNDTIVKMSEKALATAKKDAKDYKEIGKLYAENISKGFDAEYKKSVSNFNKNIDATVKKQIAELEKQRVTKKSLIPHNGKKNKGITAKNVEIKEYNKKAAEKNKDIDRQIKEYKEAGKQVGKAYEDSLKASFAIAEKTISEEMQKITEEASKQYEEIIRKKEEMEKKLADFGDLFTIDKESKEVVLSNINDQIKAIQKYDEMLTELKSKGASDGLLSEVTKLGIEDGTKYGEQLLKLTNDQFKAYQDTWTKKQKLAKEVAAKFYKDQLDALQNDMVNKLDAALKNVPNITKNVGIDSMKGMIAGMDSMKSSAVGKARDIADAIIAEMQRALDIHSPSRVMKNLIGKNIIKGVEVGIDEEKANLLKKLKGVVGMVSDEMTLTTKANNGFSGKATVVTNNNDNGVKQEINIYQPVKSPLEMMREAKRTAKELAYAN
jgi:phage tail tape measure protein, TP901 family